VNGKSVLAVQTKMFCSAAKRFVLLTLSLAFLISTETATVSFAAEPPTKEQTLLLGLYYGGGRQMLLRERDGELELLCRYIKSDHAFARCVVYPLVKEHFDSYTLTETGPLFSGDVAVRFERDAEGRGISLSINGERYSRYFLPGDKGRQALLTQNAQINKPEGDKAVMPQLLARGEAQELVNLETLVPNVKLNLVYATEENLFGQPLYTERKAYAAPSVANALTAAAKVLATHGYGLLVYEAYRPWSISRLAWELLPAENKNMIPPPEQGSEHNTGLAVDIGLYELATGAELEQISYFDEPSPRQYRKFSGGSTQQREWRTLLTNVLTQVGLVASDMEWWHFTTGNIQNAAHLNIPLSALP